MREDNVSEDLFEYEEPRGRLQILLHRIRWRWLFPGLIALSFAIPFVIANIVIPNEDSIFPNSPALESPTPALLRASARENTKTDKKGPRSGNGSGSSSSSSSSSLNIPKPDSMTEYKVTGETSAVAGVSSLSNFTDYSGLVTACAPANATGKSMLKSIAISNMYLDAAQFSSSVESCLELESISLENISLMGNFTRVYLPKVGRFVYSQNNADKRDSYKSPETLQQTMFFDKQPAPTPGESSWTVEQDLGNLGVDVTISKGGTRLLDIRHQTGEIYLNIKYCDIILLHLTGPYNSLTLINCNVSEAAIQAIPPTLTYLNVRNAVQRTPDLAQLTRKLTQLEELHVWLTFHCDWPGYELYLNFNDLPPTLQTLGINNVDTTYNKPDIGDAAGASTSIKTLTVGDYTTNRTITHGFPTLLPNLAQLNIINISDPTPAAGYAILNTAVQMKIPKITVVHLHRNFSAGDEPSQENQLQVETILDQAGIPLDGLSSFVLQLSPATSNGNSSNGVILYTGKALSADEQHRLRYTGLGFNKMDSWEDYLKWDSL